LTYAFTRLARSWPAHRAVASEFILDEIDASTLRLIRS
jgi:hypothetical protein